MKLVAQFISILFNPLVFLSLLPYLVLMKQTEDTMYALRWQLFTSLFIVLTIVLFWLGKWRGIFSDHDVSRREERPKFYFMILTLSLIYLTTSLFLKGIAFPLSIMAFGICVAIVAFAIANYRIKASGHVAVACAFVVTLGTLFDKNALLGTVWIVPLVVWARLTLKKHTLPEVIAGGTLGTVVTLLTFWLGKYIYSR